MPDIVAPDKYGKFLVDKANKNMEKWGIQDVKNLALAVAEEAGELAQAVLQAEFEGGSEERIAFEAIDLGALCVQILHKQRGGK